MRPINALLTGLAFILALSSWAPDTTAAPIKPIPGPVPTLDQPLLLDGRTALQRAIAQTVAQREARGLPVPSSVTFEITDDAVLTPPGITSQTPLAGRQTIIVATTTIQYDGPEQAGKTVWPAFEVTGSLPPGASGSVTPGDFSSLVRARLAEHVPGIWDRYTFGSEPRTYIYTERITITYPPQGPTPPGMTTDLSLADELLMGFTIVGPNLVYEKRECLRILGDEVACAEMRFGFDYGFGLRLPMQVGMTLTESMLEGSSYAGQTSASGVDWLAGEYSGAGVPPESGNEFVMRLFAGVTVTISIYGADVATVTFGIDEDHSRSFAAPFGPGATFDLPPVNIPVWGYSIGIASVEIGFQLTPRLGSDRFDAQWQVSGEGEGTGSLSYSDPAGVLALGPLKAIDGPGYANFRADGFKYYFTNFEVAPGLYLSIEALGEEVRFGFSLPGIDLSDITANLSVGPHSGTPDAFQSAIPIQNVAPRATIDRSAAWLIQGVPTFIIDRLSPQAFAGTAVDPGRDDLTLTWDWDDGLPSPDVSTTYPVPHQVTETQPHAFGSACLSRVTFKAVDDDGAVGEDRAMVLVLPEMPRVARMDGYWLHQFGQNGETDYTAAQLECLLGMVGHCSKVFNDARDVSTVQAAYDVLHPGLGGDATEVLPVEQAGDAIAVDGDGIHGRELLDRELLVTWLNFAQGTYGYFEWLDTDADGVGNTTFAGLMDAAETTRLDPNATGDALQGAIQRLHAQNVGRVGNVNRDVTVAGLSEVPTGALSATGASLEADAADDGRKPERAFEGIRCASTATGTMDIAFSVAAEGTVRLGIFDISGRRIRSFDGTYGAGIHHLRWDGRSESGRAMGSGVYILALEDARGVSRAKGVLVR